jgi:hypothetical protein
MAVWDAVGSESGANGEVVEKALKTDEEWAKVEHQALSLAEAANLLVTPGRAMSRPEEANAKTQPDAPELTPAQIERTHCSTSANRSTTRVRAVTSSIGIPTNKKWRSRTYTDVALRQ